jgi:prepilin peptidase CpaA
MTGFLEILFMHLFKMVGAGDVKLVAAVGMFVGWPDMAKVCLAILIAGGLVSVAWALWTSQWQTVLKNLQTGVMQHLRSGLMPQIGQPLITQVSLERVPYALAVGLGTAAYYAVPL